MNQFVIDRKQEWINSAKACVDVYRQLTEAAKDGTVQRKDADIYGDPMQNRVDKLADLIKSMEKDYTGENLRYGDVLAYEIRQMNREMTEILGKAGRPKDIML